MQRKMIWLGCSSTMKDGKLIDRLRFMKTIAVNSIPVIMIFAFDYQLLPSSWTACPITRFFILIDPRNSRSRNQSAHSQLMSDQFAAVTNTLQGFLVQIGEFFMLNIRPSCVVQILHFTATYQFTFTFRNDKRGTKMFWFCCNPAARPSYCCTGEEQKDGN